MGWKIRYSIPAVIPSLIRNSSPSFVWKEREGELFLWASIIKAELFA